MSVNIRNVFWNMCDAKHVVHALSETLYDVNNDFNGVNGEEFVSDKAIEAGYKSDLEYVRDLIILNNNGGQRKTVEFVVQNFLSELFADTEWYESWNYEILEHPTWGTIGVSVAWTLTK